MNDKYISRDNLELVIDGLKVGMTPDWNENDKNKFGYIRNKPFYTEYGAVVIVDNYSGGTPIPKCNFVPGNVYSVIWNGISYNGLVCYKQGEYNCIGGDGYPFYINDDGGNSLYIEPDSGFTVSVLEDIIHQLDEKYIPDSIARTVDVKVSLKNALVQKMNTSNPVGTGSFSMNRKQDAIIGDYSHAEGNTTEASGNSSHAEGYYTIASGNYSHAEGNTTEANGWNSHAEGYNTVASGNYSHAEGEHTDASGVCSHTEGLQTVASGYYSHAEGNETYAASASQHAQGEYNILDTTGSTTTRGKYAHIVGNGTSNSARSNAHTLDWDGNAWYAGTVEAKAIILSSSTEGSTKKFKLTIDDSGVLTATEITA